MLRNMKVGTKLLAVVLPPLLVLVAVAGFGARDRLDEAGDARTSEQYIDLASAGDDLITELQEERSLTVLEAITPDAAEGLDDQRGETDAAAEQFTTLAADVGESSPLHELASASGDRLVDDLATIRASADRGSIDPLIVHQWYLDTIGEILDLATEVSNVVPVSEVSADLSTLVALSRSQEALAQIQSVMTIALAQDEFDAAGRQWRAFLDAWNSASQYEALYFALATPQQAADLRGLLDNAEASDAVEFRQAVIDAISPTLHWLTTGEDVDGEPNAISDELEDYVEENDLDISLLTPSEWIGQSGTLISAQSEMGDEILSSVSGVVSDFRSETEQQALLYLLVTAVAVVVSAVVALVVARRITRPLRDLTNAADRLSGEQLPALVERLKSPGSGSGEILLEPIGMKRTDEIGHLADAFDAIQRVTVDVAEEQATLLKKGIGDIFVNLARRNQTLLDRQIEFIDQLESSEEDPDVLEDLFKLDHLATRMRRNAESLLVLAGIETGHRRSRPVALADVVRVAIGEVEDFARLNLVSMDDAVVSGSAAMDVAHLLSELMENATSFSPPETKVEILGHKNADGRYVLSISDQGIGMSDEQFGEINDLLANPPLVGLSLSRSLGFTVVGRLAARFGIDVRLTSSPTGGVTALVTLPSGILEESSITVDDDPADASASAVVETSATEVAPTEAPEEPVEAVEAIEPAAAEPETEPEPEAEPEMPVVEEPAPDWVPDAPAPTTLATAVPEGDAFDQGLAALMGEESTSSSAGEAAPQDGPSLFGAPAAEAEASAGSAPSETPPTRTAAGLVKRVPRASAPAPETTERPSPEAPIARTQRSPEEVRAMLSRYRSGLHRGRDTDSPDGPSDGSN